MQDIVHDAHSFATQITAKGACRYTNTTRNPPHRASQDGEAKPRAMDSSRNRKDVSPRSKSFGLLGRRRGHFLQQIASYERLEAGEKARGSFYICKTPGHEHSLRGFQRAPYPLDAYNSRFAAKTGVFADRESRHLHGRRGREGRPRSPPTGKIARGFAQGGQRGADRRLSDPQCRWGLSPAWRAEAPVEEKASAGRSILGAREREPYTARQVGRSGTRTLM